MTLIECLLRLKQVTLLKDYGQVMQKNINILKKLNLNK